MIVSVDNSAVIAPYGDKRVLRSGVKTTSLETTNDVTGLIDMKKLPMVEVEGMCNPCVVHIEAKRAGVNKLLIMEYDEVECAVISREDAWCAFKCYIDLPTECLDDISYDAPLTLTVWKSSIGATSRPYTINPSN